MLWSYFNSSSTISNKDAYIKVINSYSGDTARLFNQCPVYIMKILLGDFNVKLEQENILILKTESGLLHPGSNDDGII